MPDTSEPSHRSTPGTCVVCGSSKAVAPTGLCATCGAGSVAPEDRIEVISETLHDPLDHYRGPLSLVDDAEPERELAMGDRHAGSGVGFPAFDPRVLKIEHAERRQGEPRQKTVETRQRMRQAPRHQKNMPRTKKAAR